MSVLPKILKELEISSTESFQVFLQKNDSESLKVFRENNGMNIELPDYKIENNEIHGEFINLKNQIIDMSQLSLYPKAGLSLKNCIFTGKLNIHGKESIPTTSIEIENCVFMKELIISGFPQGMERKIQLLHTNVAYFSLYNMKAAEIILSSCKIFFTAIHKTEALKFDTENNELRHFEIEGTDFKEVHFDYRQFDINRMGKRIIKNLQDFQFEAYAQLNMDMNLFLFLPYKTSEDIKKGESYNTMIETINFLKSSTTLGSDRNRLTKLMFYEVLLKQDNRAHKTFVWATGGFMNPFRFMLIAFIILLSFAGLYTLPGLTFFSIHHGEMQSLPIGQALYFSGVAFTTIGFGDISPMGISRLFAITEGILGISTMSAFLVALVKKYID